MKVKKRLSVKEFTKLVNHHSVNNIKVFRERLRLQSLLKNNEPLSVDMVSLWEDICKLHEQKIPWVEAMDQIIKSYKESIQTNTVTQKKTIDVTLEKKLDCILNELQNITKSLELLSQTKTVG